MFSLQSARNLFDVQISFGCEQVGKLEASPGASEKRGWGELQLAQDKMVEAARIELASRNLLSDARFLFRHLPELDYHVLVVHLDPCRTRSPPQTSKPTVYIILYTVSLIGWARSDRTALQSYIPFLPYPRALTVLTIGG